VSCSQIVSSQTAQQLNGEGGDEAQCGWPDRSTLVAYLTLRTQASSGMRVALLQSVIWPAEWNYPGSCNGAESKCSTAASSTIYVPTDFPCDMRSTTQYEPCIQPGAVISAPSELSSCPGTSLTLDGSRSSGGGITGLIYEWHADPLLCDNYYAVQSTLDSVGSSPSVSLRGELDGGQTFVFYLVVSQSIVGTSSWTSYNITRQTLPIPTIFIDAPPLLLFRSYTSIDLEGSATLPACFSQSNVLSAAYNLPSHLCTP
jgi:hypothetical protein